MKEGTRRLGDRFPRSVPHSGATNWLDRSLADYGRWQRCLQVSLVESGNFGLPDGSGLTYKLSWGCQQHKGRERVLLI